MVAGRCLQIPFLKRFTMLGTIALVHIHVIHVDRYPHIRRSIGNLIIDMLVDEEIISLCITILDIIDSGLLDGGEIELHILIFKIRTP